MEVGQSFQSDLGAAEAAILDSWRDAAETWLPETLRPPPWPAAAPGRRIGSALSAWARSCARPLVIFLDEIDALRGEVLLATLRQLRDGYPRRPSAFPWSHSRPRSAR